MKIFINIVKKPHLSKNKMPFKLSLGGLVFKKMRYIIIKGMDLFNIPIFKACPEVISDRPHSFIVT